MNTDAGRIIRQVVDDVAHIDNPIDRLARMVGRLQGEIRSLCNALAEFDNAGSDDEQLAMPVTLSSGAAAMAYFCRESGELLAVQVRGADVLDALSADAVCKCEEAWFLAGVIATETADDHPPV